MKMLPMLMVASGFVSSLCLSLAFGITTGVILYWPCLDVNAAVFFREETAGIVELGSFYLMVAFLASMFNRKTDLFGGSTAARRKPLKR